MFSIIVFRSLGAVFAPRSVYGVDQAQGAAINAGAARLPDCAVYRDLSSAISEARQASRNYGALGVNSARYAVYDADAVSFDPAGDLVLLSSRPVFIPSGSDDLAHSALGLPPAGLLIDRLDNGLSPEAEAARLVNVLAWAGVPVPAVGAWVDGGRPVSLRPLPPLPSSPSSSLVSAAAALAVSPVAAPEAVAAPSVRFEVRAGLNGTDRDTWSSVHDADNGKAAAAWVAANRAAFAEAGKSLAIVKVEAEALSVDWRAREQARLDSGEYLPLPGDWSWKVAGAYPDHFAHIAKGDKRKVAFTESEAAGARDRQKVLSAAEYARRYFDRDAEGWSPDPEVRRRSWSPETRREFANAMLGSSLVPLFTPLGDGAAMARVYVECHDTVVHSCMSHTVRNFRTGDVHPVEVYARGGEITLAFLRGYGDGERPEAEDGEDAPSMSPRDLSGLINPGAVWDGSGPVLARCLVWDDSENSGRKEYGRVYGRSDDQRALRTALEALGYVSGDLEGARLAKIPVERFGSNCFVMPYLDIGGGHYSDCGDHFIATCDGEQSGCRTDGLGYLEDPRPSCEHCDSHYDAEDGSTVYTGRWSSETWCESCVSDHAFYCDHLEEYVTDSERGEYVPEGSSWPISIAEWCLSDVAEECRDGVWRAGAFECDDCSGTFGPEDRTAWDGDRETGDPDRSGETEDLCPSCYRERDALADAHAEAEAAEAASSPELPLDFAA